MTTATLYSLYLVFALGGVGVYLMLPKAEQTRTVAGATIGLLALVGLIALLLFRLIPPERSNAFFYLFSIVALLAAARVITHARPVYSALYFVLVVVAVAAMLVLLKAEFVAVALIIIYAGAILVTYLFVIMLAQSGGSPVYDRRSREPFLAVLVCFVLLGAIVSRVGGADSGGERTMPDPTSAEARSGSSLSASPENAANAGTSMELGNSLAIGAIVMTKYVVTLQVAGILLLVSMIGAIALSRKRVPAEGFVSPRRPVGEAGRNVEPF